MRLVASIMAALFVPTSLTMGAIKTETIEYKVGDTTHKGFIAYDDAKTNKRPGILVVHEWWGLNDYPKMRATMLAEMGYVAFCADMFGEGKTTKDAKQAAEWATDHRGDMNRAAARSLAAHTQLSKHPLVDSTRMAGIGYCFGGTSVLNMARAGMPLLGVVSFHGSLGSTWKAQMGVTNAKMLVCHGADDTFLTPDEITGFQKEMADAGVDWQMIYYSNAVHAFTNPNADKAGIPGVAYNKPADERSWAAMKLFFEELFTAKE